MAKKDNRKKSKMEVNKMASDEVTSEIMLQQEKSHWQGSKGLKMASNICKKVKSIQILSDYYVINWKWTMKGDTKIYSSFGKYKPLDQPINKQK